MSGHSLPELEQRVAAFNEAKGIIRNTLKASEGEHWLWACAVPVMVMPQCMLLHASAPLHACVLAPDSAKPCHQLGL